MWDTFGSPNSLGMHCWELLYWIPHLILVPLCHLGGWKQHLAPPLNQESLHFPQHCHQALDSRMVRLSPPTVSGRCGHQSKECSQCRHARVTTRHAWHCRSRHASFAQYTSLLPTFLVIYQLNLLVVNLLTSTSVACNMWVMGHVLLK